MSQKGSDNPAVIVPFRGRQALSCQQSFEHRVDLSLAMARRTAQRLSMFSIRVDCGASFMRLAGREAQNELLKKLYECLAGLVPPTGQIGWLRHDELAVVQFTHQDVFAIYRNGKKLLSDLKRLVLGQREKHSLKLSLGIALYPEDGNTRSALLGRAHAAAKRASRWNSDGFCFSSQAAGREVADRLTMDVALQRALKARALDMRFQPVFDLRQSCMTGINGSAVWSHPNHGSKSDEEIMQTVDRAGLADVYNSWLVELVCRQSGQWSKRTRCRKIGIKANRSQLVEGTLAVHLSAALERYQVSPSLIEIAIDREFLVDGTDHRLHAGIQQLSELGAHLIIANVGIEPLPLKALTTLPLNGVELSPELVSTVGRCSISERMLNALINLTSTLGLKARATGVASEEQLDFLNQQHCDEVTGPTVLSSMSARDIDALRDIQACSQSLGRQVASEKRRCLAAHRPKIVSSEV